MKKSDEVLRMVLESVVDSNMKMHRTEFPETSGNTLVFDEDHPFHAFQRAYDKGQNEETVLAYKKFLESDALDFLKSFQGDIVKTLETFDRLNEDEKNQILVDWMDGRTVEQRMQVDGFNLDDNLYVIYQKGNKSKSDTRNGLILFWSGMRAITKQRNEN